MLSTNLQTIQSTQDLVAGSSYYLNATRNPITVELLHIGGEYHRVRVTSTGQVIDVKLKHMYTASP